jgi:hypothetical protein
MLWVVLAALLACPAWADGISDSTRAHLQSLEATKARLESEGNKGKYYQKVKGEIARIRAEYRLGDPAEAGAKPGHGAAAAAQARAAEQARAEAEAERRAKAEAEARAEARARQVDPRWEKSKDEFASLAEEELKRRQWFSRFYRRRAEWQHAYNSQLRFAQAPIAAGGLGYDFTEADGWAKRVLELQPPEAIAAFRRRYEKVLAYVRLPKEQGGLGHVRAYARKVALDVAQGSNDAQIDEWIAQNRRRVLSERGGFARFKHSCHAWYKAFGG